MYNVGYTFFVEGGEVINCWHGD